MAIRVRTHKYTRAVSVRITYSFSASCFGRIRHFNTAIPPPPPPPCGDNFYKKTNIVIVFRTRPPYVDNIYDRKKKTRFPPRKFESIKTSFRRNFRTIKKYISPKAIFSFSFYRLTAAAEGAHVL